MTEFTHQRQAELWVFRTQCTICSLRGTCAMHGTSWP